MTDKENNSNQAQEIESLQRRLEEAEETLRAIRSGEVDALVMDVGQGEQVFTLRTAETAYRVAIESINEGVLTLSADGLIIYANCAMGYLLNQPLEQLTGESVFDFTDAVNSETLATMLKNGTGRHEITFKSAAGMMVPTLVSVTTLPLNSIEVLTLVAVVTDLTELKRRDEVIAQGKLLRESEEEARKQMAEIQAIYDTARVGLTVLDRDLRYVRINQRLAEMNGLPASEHIGKTVEQVVPTLAPAIREMAEQIFASGIGVKDVEFSGSLPSAPDVQRTWLEQWMPINNASGRVIALNVVVEEITDRKKAEETLRKYELLAANTRDIILFLNYKDGQILEANKAAEAAYGYSRDELLTKKIADLRAKETQSLVERQLARANSQGALFETSHFRRDGISFPVEVSSQGLDFNGQRTLISVIRDITERKKAEKALAESEEKYRGLFERMSEGFILCKVITDSEGKPVDYQFLEANSAAEKYFERPCSEIIGNTYKTLGGPNADPEWIKILGGVAQTGEQVTLERYAPVGGQWVSLQAYSPNPGQFAATFTTITERKRAEQALRQSEEKFRLHAENSPLAIVEWDGSFIITRWAGAAEKMFGWSAAETIGKPIADLKIIYEPDIPIVEKTMVKLTDGVTHQVVSSNRNVTRDGRIIDCTWYNSVLYGQNGKMVSVMSQVEDFTERNKAEKALQESENRYRSLFEGIPISTVVFQEVEGDFVIVDYNRQSVKFTSGRMPDFVGKKASELYATVPAILEKFASVSRSKSNETLEMPYRKISTGEELFLKATLAYVLPDKIILHSEDITDLKKAELALKNSEERYRALVDLAPDAIIVHHDGRIHYANSPAVRLFGAGSFEELAAHNILDLIHPKDVEKARNSIESVQKGAITQMSERLAFRLDGQQWIMEAAGSPIDWQGERCVQVIIRDVTERKKLEQELAAAKTYLEEQVEDRTHDLWAQVQTTKRAEAELRALSNRMIIVQEDERRAIAKELHDEIGQTLTVLKLMAGSLNKTIPEELKPRVEAMNKELSDVMSRVRLMSQSLRPTVLDDLGLIPGLEWMFAKLKEQAGLQVEFVCPKLDKLDQNVSITAYRIIQESLTNVMRHSGVKSAFVHISHDDKELRIRVTDYGRGFNQLELRTSTGLSAMRERAKLVGGTVELESAPGKGTVVSATIPLKVI